MRRQHAERGLRSQREAVLDGLVQGQERGLGVIERHHKLDLGVVHGIEHGHHWRSKRKLKYISMKIHKCTKLYQSTHVTSRDTPWSPRTSGSFGSLSVTPGARTAPRHGARPGTGAGHELAFGALLLHPPSTASRAP